MQQLDSVSQWCHDTGSLISPDKAQTLWCTLGNRAAGKPMPAVTLDRAVAERTSHLRYLWVHLDRMLAYRKHVETTALKCKKGLSVLKAMAAKGIEQRHLFLLSHNNGTDKSAKAGQSAERGSEGHTENHHGHTH